MALIGILAIVLVSLCILGSTGFLTLGLVIISILLISGLYVIVTDIRKGNSPLVAIGTFTILLIIFFWIIKALAG